MTSRDIVIVTCATWPQLSVSDSMLADELVRRGHIVSSHPWNAAPIDAFTTADRVLLRSNWDYHHDVAAFDRWLSDVEHSPAALLNPGALVRAFLDKSSLLSLDVPGVAIPQTLVVRLDELVHPRRGRTIAATVTEWADRNRLDRVVVKPAWGASGHGVELIQRAGLDEVVTRWCDDPDRRSMLVQEFVPAINTGERALVYFGGEYSHALLRRPAPADFRVNSQYGGSMTLCEDVRPDLVEFGERVIAALPVVPTYVRVDVVSDGADHVLMEVELNEPALGLHLAPDAAGRFADAVVG